MANKGFPVAQGKPSHSGSLIPTIWAKQFLVYFYMATSLAAISNTDYEGTIKQHGDTVIANYLLGGDPKDYTDGQDLEYDEPETGTRELVIDKGKYWAFNASLIDKHQSNIAFIEKWADHYSQNLKRSIEKSVYASVFADADAANSGDEAGVDTRDINLGKVGAPLELTKTTIIDQIVDWGDVLDQQNIPDTQRWLILPTWACAMIKKSELRDASITGDNKSVLRNGRIGMIDRFEIFSSRNLASGTDGSTKVWNPMFGHKSAITFATQLTAQERVPNYKRFGEAIRALQSYGFAVFQPEALGHAYIYKG